MIENTVINYLYITCVSCTVFTTTRYYVFMFEVGEMTYRTRKLQLIFKKYYIIFLLFGSTPYVG